MEQVWSVRAIEPYSALSATTASMSILGAQLAPVVFKLGNREISPFHIAPWCEETIDGPPIIQALRGDFFCLPFGGNSTAYGDEEHPLHGETANREWTLFEKSKGHIVCELDLEIRKGRVRREVLVNDDETAVYVATSVQGMSGPMCFGNHAMLQFRSPGLVSTSEFEVGQVFPGEFEIPAQGGYSSLEPGSRFQRLEVVPMANGSVADLSLYPAREGFEDLVQLVGRSEGIGWNAVVFPEEGFLWFCLRNRRTLPHTILWHSNGGRHYAPWNGRHKGVLGIEDVNAYFHYGLAESASSNPFAAEGFSTAMDFKPDSTVRIPTIMGVAQVGHIAEHVESIQIQDEGIEIQLRSGEVIPVSAELDFLQL